ncbi:hypothetical protein [Methylorubrum sp. POS3]|uniref:hypothetical protein n=1 Tax=Methylorubrum sp. POS3 TaxID=2998492 RepID=UPI0037286FEF
MTNDQYILDNLARMMSSAEERVAMQAKDMFDRIQNSQNSDHQDLEIAALVENYLALRRLRLQALEKL